MGWRRWVAALASVSILEGLVLTNTRGAFLGLVAGFLVLAVFKAKAHRRLFWGVAVLALAGFASIVDKSFVERMGSIAESTADTEEADQSARSRIVVARAQVQMFMDYPMGSGHRGTPALSPHYLEQRWLTTDESGDSARASHNTFMTTLVEQGVPGAMIFIWVALWTLLTIVRLRVGEARYRDAEMTTLVATVAAVLASVFVAGNTADYLMAEVQFWMFATLVSLQRFASLKAAEGQRSDPAHPAHSRLPTLNSPKLSP